MRDAILVTAIGSFSAVTVIEKLKKEGYQVIGCDIYPAEWVANSRLTDVFYQAPYATDREAYQEFIRMVCHEEEAAFVMPLTDVEIDLFRDWKTAEEETGAIICMSDRTVLEICRNKWKLETYLKEKKVCTTIPGQLLSEISEVHAMDYPVVVKPIDGRSSQGLRMVYTEKEMELLMELCKEERNRYIVQPKISGAIITVDVVRNPESGACVCIPRRELLRTPNGAGTSVYVFKNPYLEEECRAIAEALNIRGCVNFEFIEEEEPQTPKGKGKWRFLECNPRFSGGLAFSVLAGYDMVRNHLNCFLGRNLEPEGCIEDQYIARRYEEYRMD